jgi:hypothetical protein
MSKAGHCGARLFYCLTRVINRPDKERQEAIDRRQLIDQQTQKRLHSGYGTLEYISLFLYTYSMDSQ